MSKRKLLLADDSVTIQKVVNLTFADEGIDVITVGDGDSAMEMIGQATPDLVLADVHMPGLSGYEICERLRQDPHTRDLPVVLLVGSFEPFDEGEAARVGANAYLTKPFQSIRQLVTQVSDLMTATRPADEETGADVEQQTEAGEQHDFADQAAAENAQGPDSQPDLTDIESLYNQSVSAGEAPEADSGSPTYVDAGMDDEMIEARYVDDEADTDPDMEVSEIPAESYREDDHVTPPSQAYSESANPFGSVATQPEPGDQHQEVQAQPAYDPYSATERMPSAAELAEQVASVMPEVERDLSLDDSDLLELPPLGPGDSVHVGAPGTTNPEGQRVVTMAPELVDMIVQKVVERLSEKS